MCLRTQDFPPLPSLVRTRALDKKRGLVRTVARRLREHLIGRGTAIPRSRRHIEIPREQRNMAQMRGSRGGLLGAHKDVILIDGSGISMYFWYSILFLKRVGHYLEVVTATIGVAISNGWILAMSTSWAEPQQGFPTQNPSRRICCLLHSVCVPHAHWEGWLNHLCLVDPGWSSLLVDPGCSHLNHSKLVLMNIGCLLNRPCINNCYYTIVMVRYSNTDVWYFQIWVAEDGHHSCSEQVTSYRCLIFNQY